MADHAEGLLAALVPDLAYGACTLRLRPMHDVFGDRAYPAQALPTAT